ncbi:MAG: hypothetical protein E3J64_08770, partial [Anaerolineales bacterium]
QWLHRHLLHNVAGGDETRVRSNTKSIYLAAIRGFVKYLVVTTDLIAIDRNAYEDIHSELASQGHTEARESLPESLLPSGDIIHALVQEASRPVALPPGLPGFHAWRLRLASLRDKAIIEVLLSTGMRVGELVRLERRHLLHELPGATIEYGKGGKQREVRFSNRAWGFTQEYLAQRADSAAGQSLATLPVFARHDPGAGRKVKSLTTRGVQTILERLATRARILERFHLTPHSLRHWFATEFLSQTGDLALTQHALGHARPTTTRIYAKTKKEDYERAHQKVFDSG